MKKFLAFMFAVTMSLTAVNASEQASTQRPDNRPPFQHKVAPDIEKARADFEQKLGLTDAQKAQAKELRKQGFEKMKPIIVKTQAKIAEAEAVKKSQLTENAKKEQLAQIDKDLADLHKQMNEIRKSNMKDFEAILTSEQKKTLDEMKKEGRKNFKAKHQPGCKIHQFQGYKK